MAYRFKQRNQPWALAGLLLAVWNQPSELRAQQWQLVQPSINAPPRSFDASAQSAGQAKGSLQWSAVPAQRPAPKQVAPEPEQAATTNTSELQWQTLSAEQIEHNNQAIQEEIEQAQERINNPTVQYPPSGPTYANFRALWRDGDWLPQISNTVPVGFGPQGVMATFEYRGIDCITGAGLCKVPGNLQDYKDQIQKSGDAFFDWSIGFGDSSKYFGVVLTAVIEGTETPFAGSQRQAAGPGFLADKNLGVHLARSFGPDTGIRIGVDNLFREVCGNGACGLPQSAYGVISQRLRFSNNPAAWFGNAYLTAGAGNGSFRSLGNQIQASYLAQRAAGCSTYGYQPKKDCSETTRRRAVFGAYDYGDLFPIASVGVEVVRGFNLITEWSGRNLNAGLSFRPFPELGLVITPMFENLVSNCDYGCRVSVPNYPDGAPLPENVLTERPRFSIQASIEVKF